MTRVVAVQSVEQAAGGRSDFDAVVLVAHDPGSVKVPILVRHLKATASADAGFASNVNFVPATGVAGNRLVVSPTGPLGRDHDDVRRYAEAARAGVRRARDAGAIHILLVLQNPPAGRTYVEAPSVASLGALAGLWEPLEARETLGEGKVEPVQTLGIARTSGKCRPEFAAWVQAVDGGLRLARDVAGTNPERMAPPKLAAHLQTALRGLPVKIEVSEDTADCSRAIRC